MSSFCQKKFLSFFIGGKKLKDYLPMSTQWHYLSPLQRKASVWLLGSHNPLLWTCSHTDYSPLSWIWQTHFLLTLSFHAEYLSSNSFNLDGVCQEFSSKTPHPRKERINTKFVTIYNDDLTSDPDRHATFRHSPGGKTHRGEYVKASLPGQFQKSNVIVERFRLEVLMKKRCLDPKFLSDKKILG